MRRRWDQLVRLAIGGADSSPPWLPKRAVPEVLTLWLVCFAAVVVTYLTLRPAAKVVATVGFLYLPELAMKGRGEDYRDYGLTLRTLGRDLRHFLGVSVVVFPLFVLGFFALAWVWEQLPAGTLDVLTPYRSAPHFTFRWPDRFSEWIIDQLFVVAVPEEFFYRGYLQRRLRDAWPGGRVFLGARLGKAFWLTAALFALGHLAIFAVFRLGVFFPALIFGWLRERTGSIVAAALFHAAANLLLKVLEASFFGP